MVNLILSDAKSSIFSSILQGILGKLIDFWEKLMKKKFHIKYNTSKISLLVITRISTALCRLKTVCYFLTGLTITTSLWCKYSLIPNFISEENVAQRENLTCPRSHTYKVVKPGLRSKCCCFSFCLPPNMAHSSATLGPATQFQPKLMTSTSSSSTPPWILAFRS